MSAPSAVCPRASSSPSDPRLTGQKYSRQRVLVYQAVAEAGCHPTADEVYQRVRVHCPDISLGTVYRNLGKLVEGGMLRKIGVPGGSDHFDGTLHEHYHIICKSCGCIADVHLPGLEALDRQVQAETDYTVTGHDLILYGLCKDCAEKKNTVKEENEK